jgi:hypothetical protein
MTDDPASAIMARGIETCAEEGKASGIGRALSLAAAPTFAIMALWSNFHSGQSDMLCMAMRSSSMNDMSVMYLLMSVFHLAPWLTLFLDRRDRAEGIK